MPWKPLEGELFPTLGWHVADQMAEFLDFQVSREQLEFLIRFYEIDPLTLRRVKRRGIIQRARGWGKSPKLAAIGIAEALFEVVPAGWDANGQPVGAPWSEYKRIINVVVTATSEDQVANTWAPLLDFARTDALVNEFGIEPMETFIAIPGGKIEPRTSKGRSIKGLPGQVCALMDQTEEWVAGNGGPRLAQNIRNNATKADGVTIESPNAFTPGEKSVAEASALDWELIKSGKYPKLNEARQILYDHREAPPTTDMADHDSLIAGLRYAYGDSSDHPDGCVIHDPPCAPGWAPIETIALAFLDTSNDPQVLQADFLNQITHASDSWLSQPELKAIDKSTVLEFKEVSRQDAITLGFDGSRGRSKSKPDATALIGCRVSDGHLFKLGVWEPPDGPGEKGWSIPEAQVEAAVRQAFLDFNVVGFYADPAMWDGHVAQWEAAYGRRLKVVNTREKPIAFNTRSITAVVRGFESLQAAIVNREITYDGSYDLTRHFLNARRQRVRSGIVLRKPNNDYLAKIDAAYAAMLAYACRIDALGKGVGTRRTGSARRIY